MSEVISDAVRNAVRDTVARSRKSAISRLYQSELMAKDPLVHHWLSVYMQGQHTEDEILYELIVALHSNSEVLRRTLIEYHSTFGPLPKAKEPTP